MEELFELKDQLTKGKITETEYEIKKTLIIDQLTRSKYTKKPVEKKTPLVVNKTQSITSLDSNDSEETKKLDISKVKTRSFQNIFKKIKLRKSVERNLTLSDEGSLSDRKDQKDTYVISPKKNETKNNQKIKRSSIQVPEKNSNRISCISENPIVSIQQFIDSPTCKVD